MAEFMDTSQEEALDQCADDEKDQGAQHQGHPELAGCLHDDGVRKIGAQHVHGGMGKVQDVHHPENKGEACRDEKKKSGVGQAVEKKNGNVVHYYSFLFTDVALNLRLRFPVGEDYCSLLMFIDCWD